MCFAGAKVCGGSRPAGARASLSISESAPSSPRCCGLTAGGLPSHTRLHGHERKIRLEGCAAGEEHRRAPEKSTGDALDRRPAYVDEVGAVGHTCEVTFLRSRRRPEHPPPYVRRAPSRCTPSASCAPRPGGFLLLPNTLRPERAPWHRSP